jgi:hypothetical protein
MAASFVAVGTSGSANNANVTPTLPAGHTTGDVLFVAAMVRHATATLSVSGYTQVALIPHASASAVTVGLWRKTDGGAESNPTVAVSGGAAGADVIASCCAFRGMDTTTPVVETGTGSSNGSAANIGAITGLSLANGNVVLVIGARSDDWTSVATLSGDGLTWNEIIETVSTAGTDAGFVWDYAINTSGSAVTVTSKTFTVTGGTANPGLGFMAELAVAGGATVSYPSLERAFRGVHRGLVKAG